MADTVQTLNNLIARCRDSEEGFGEIGQVCRSGALRERLMGIARQRADFARELAGYVRKLNGVPAAAAHRNGALDQGWRKPDESNGDASCVASCIAGEENTLRAYEVALTRDLPVAVRPVVDRQRLAVQETLLELRSVQMVRTA